MKNTTPILLLAIIAILAWFTWSTSRENAALQAQVSQMQADYAEIQNQVLALQEQLQRAEKETVTGVVEGVVEDANNSLKQGLRTMLEAAEQEFNKLQRTLDETLQDWEAMEEREEREEREEGEGNEAGKSQPPHTDDHPEPAAADAGQTMHQT